MDETDERVAKILTLGARKKAAYLRMDELKMQLLAGGSLMTIVRAFFPSRRSRAIRQEYDDTVRTIEVLRWQMDELHQLLPGSRMSELAHLWSYENTTSLFEIRREKKKKS
jgi:hypothetical protein